MVVELISLTFSQQMATEHMQGNPSDTDIGHLRASWAYFN
jgi:hypothetical protein